MRALYSFRAQLRVVRVQLPETVVGRSFHWQLAERKQCTVHSAECRVRSEHCAVHSEPIFHCERSVCAANCSVRRAESALRALKVHRAAHQSAQNSAREPMSPNCQLTRQIKAQLSWRAAHSRAATLPIRLNAIHLFATNAQQSPKRNRKRASENASTQVRATTKQKSRPLARVGPSVLGRKLAAQFPQTVSGPQSCGPSA